jgi:hypothetical protein
MKKRLFTLSLLVAATLCTLGLTVDSADAAALRGYKAVLVVPGGLNPDDLHVTFTGTGGSIANVAVNPAGATAVSGGGNTIDVTWGGKLPPGTVITITFTAEFAGVAFSSGTWTNATVVIGNVTGGQITVNQYALPGVSPLSMMLMALGIAGVGMYALKPRRVEA